MPQPDFPSIVRVGYWTVFSSIMVSYSSTAQNPKTWCFFAAVSRAPVGGVLLKNCKYIITKFSIELHTKFSTYKYELENILVSPQPCSTYVISTSGSGHGSGVESQVCDSFWYQIVVLLD
jgi:hypothetical protein